MKNKIINAIRTFRIKHRLHKQGSMASAAHANWQRLTLHHQELQGLANAAKLEADEALAMYAQARNRELIFAKLLDRVSISGNKNESNA